MSDRITIPIPKHICGNCDQLNKAGLCLIQNLKKEKEDISCSQIYEHYIGDKKDEDTQQ